MYHPVERADPVGAPMLIFWKQDVVTVAEHFGSTGRP
jgi:hypothetical protein